MTQKGRGYKIRVRRDGRTLSEDWLVWGIDGVLPEQWGKLKYDPSVQHAEIRYNAGPNRRGGRVLLDEYIRPGGSQ